MSSDLEDRFGKNFIECRRQRQRDKIVRKNNSNGKQRNVIGGLCGLSGKKRENKRNWKI